MKIIAKKQLIAMALMGSMSQVAIANTVNCEENFGPWCDLANFLEQQEATAAGGPLAENVINLDNINFDSEEFNGQVENNTTAAAPEKIYESYVLLYNETGTLNKKNSVKNKIANNQELAKAEFSVDENNNITSFKVTRSSDQKTFDLTQQLAGKALTSLQKTNSVPRFTKDLQAGTAEREVLRAVFGKLTNKADITDLANKNAIFTYKIKGNHINQANKIGSFSNKNMVVNFNQGSWTMEKFFGTNITNGSIDGNTFSSNGSIVSRSKNYTVGSDSYVSGSFFDASAENVAGDAKIIRNHVTDSNKDKSNTILFHSYKKLDNSNKVF